MQKRIKNLFKDNFIIIAFGITILIAVLSLIELKESSIKISNSDKFEHAFAYFTLALSWMLSIPKAHQQQRIRNLIAIGCVFYGIIIEVLQETVTNYRTASAFDAVANSIGVILALVLFKIIFKKLKLFNN